MRCRHCQPLPEDVRRAADLLGRRYALAIVYASRSGATRFNEFRQVLGPVPPTTLSARLEELAVEDWVREDTAERMRGLYRFRQGRFSARFDEDDDGAIEQQSQNYQRLRRELLDAERRAVVELRRLGRINDDVMNIVQRDLDLEDARLDV